MRVPTNKRLRGFLAHFWDKALIVATTEELLGNGYFAGALLFANFYIKRGIIEYNDINWSTKKAAI